MRNRFSGTVEISWVNIEGTRINSFAANLATIKDSTLNFYHLAGFGSIQVFQILPGNDLDVPVWPFRDTCPIRDGLEADHAAVFWLVDRHLSFPFCFSSQLATLFSNKPRFPLCRTRFIFVYCVTSLLRVRLLYSTADAVRLMSLPSSAHGSLRWKQTDPGLMLHVLPGWDPHAIHHERCGSFLVLTISNVSR